MELNLVRQEFALTCLRCGLVLPLILVVAKEIKREITTQDVQNVIQNPGYTDYYQRPVPDQRVRQPALGVCEKSLAGTGPHAFDAKSAVAVE